MESQSSISLLSKNCIPADLITWQRSQDSISEGFEGKKTSASSKEWASKPARHGILGFLPTVAVLVMTLGFAGLILGVLLGRQCSQVQGGHGIMAAIRAGYFVTSEEQSGGTSSSGHLRVLTLSALASHLISDTSSILMTLIAYRIGASWLRHSKSPDLSDVSQNPTPRQYGLLLRLMGSSSVLAVAESCFYTARSKKRSRLPRMFREALAFAVLVWVLSRLVGLVDLWLHTTSSSSLEYVPTNQPGGTHMLGAAFNNSLCADLSAKYPKDAAYDPPGFPCLTAYEDFVSLEHWGNDLGFAVMTNATNSPFNVVTMQDNVLVAVPGPLVGFGDYAFTAPTFAVHASCDSINHICSRDQQGITVNCTAAGYPELPYVFSQKDGFRVTNTSQVDNRIFGIIDGKMMGREIGSFEITTAVTKNPTTMAVQLRWDPPQQGMSLDKETHSPGAINLTELAIDTYPNPTLYASCTVSYLDAVVKWDGSNGSWSLFNTTLASQQLTAALWLPVVWQFATEQLASSLMNVARTRPRGEVMAVLNQQLARLALGSAAGFFKPAAATDVSHLVQTMLAKYPVGPILALLTLLSLYAILALTIFLISLWEKDETIIAPYDALGEGVHVGEPSSLVLAQRWLVTPMPLVGSAFPRDDGRDPKRSVAAWVMGSAQDGGEKDDRLMIGVKNEGFGVVSLRHRHRSSEEN